MAKHGRGLICLALTKKQIDNLKLPLMSPNNKSRMQTAFTISIEARKELQLEFLHKIEQKLLKQLLILKQKKMILFLLVMFSLSCRNGGVLERAGHTEAS